LLEEREEKPVDSQQQQQHPQKSLTDADLIKLEMIIGEQEEDD
jgi:hypothetical protein